MKVLLVRLRQIGDVVFTTPALRGLRERFPDAHLTYLVEALAAPVVALNPHLTDVMVVPARRGLDGFRDDLSLARRLRASRFDLAIDFHGGPRASFLTWASGAPRRIGYDVVGRGWMYTERVARPRALRARHSVENQWDLLTPLGIGPPGPGSHPVEMPVDPEAARAVQGRLEKAGVGRNASIIVVHVSAGNPFRRWPPHSFAAVVADLIPGDQRRHAIVTSGPSEAEAAGQVIAAARARLPETDRRRVVGAGEFSLAELRALVESAALYIGGDSGPVHIAATSPVSIVTLYGPTLPARSAPWRAASVPSEAVETTGLPCRPCDQRVCAPGDFRCLGWITPEQVVQAAARALAAASK